MSDENIIRFLEEIGQGRGIVMLVGDPHDENNATMLNGLILEYSFDIQQPAHEIGLHGGASYRMSTGEPDVTMNLKISLLKKQSLKKEDVAKEVGHPDSDQLTRRTMLL